MTLKHIFATIGVAAFCSVAVAVAPSVPPTVQGAEATGEALSHTCAACHGTYGELKGEHFVPLASMAPDEFIASMKEFKSLKRPSSIMSHIAEGYSDAEIERMAAFFAEIKPGVQK